MSRFDVFNPATDEVVGSAPEMGAKETREAIEAAQVEFASWSKRPSKERSEILEKWYELTMAAQEELAQIMTAECGKPLAESRGEVAYGASFIKWYAEEAKRVYGEMIPAASHDKRLLVMKQPIGVVACITPWNFPLAMITRKMAPALAVGCTGVVKPAAETPLSAIRMAEIAYEAGIPRDAMAIITGTDAKAIGGEMTSNPIVRKVSFTGSTAVGKLLMAQSASTVKKMALELGGNAPFIVFDDADLDAAVAGAIASKYRNAGQTCVCANRFLVQAGVYDAFTEKLAEAVKALKIGNGVDDGVNIGPLISKAGIEKVQDHVADAIAHGGEVMVGGKAIQRAGHFFEPTVIKNVSLSAKVAREETFGPLAPIFKFETEEEAVKIANDTEFGLAAYFYAQNISRIFRVSEALEYGMVGVNEGIISTEVAPFGGVKESGLGREGSHFGADEFLELKYVCLGGMKGSEYA